MAVIDIGDGRFIDFDEGEPFRLSPTPPPEPKPKRVKGKGPVRRSKAITFRGHKYRCVPPRLEKLYAKEGGGVALMERVLAIPGFTEWSARRLTQMRLLVQTGRKVGQAKGKTVERSEALWIKARRQARRDMEQIKQKIDLTDAAAEALEATLTTMRAPMNQQVKLAAAKLVLDFTMAKPVAKSEVTVNAAEKWLAEIGKDDSE